MSTKVSDKQPVWQKLFTSQVGKKLLTGITGLGLTLFVLAHMAGNLSYFVGHEAYNAYAHKLMSLGPLFYLIELVLLAFFVFHIVLGINIFLGKRAARKQGYKRYKTVGGASRQSLSSRSMIITGITLAVFLVFHLISFKYGEYIDSTTQFDGGWEALPGPRSTGGKEISKSSIYVWIHRHDAPARTSLASWRMECLPISGGYESAFDSAYLHTRRPTGYFDSRWVYCSSVVDFL